MNFNMKMTKEDHWQTNVVSTENMSCMKFRPDCSPSRPDMYNKWFDSEWKKDVKWFTLKKDMSHDEWSGSHENCHIGTYT